MFRIGAGLCGVVTLLAVSPANGQALRLQAVGIELTRLSPPTIEVMTDELNTLVARSGVSVEWRRARPESETAPQELRVVFLDSPGRGARANSGVLAAAGPNLHTPTVWVYTPTVVRALGPVAHFPPESLVVQRALGVALGQVVAHELVHLLAPEVPHGTGLMALCVRPGAFGGLPPRLDAATAEAFATGARSWLGRRGPSSEAERRAQVPRPAPPVSSAKAR